MSIVSPIYSPFSIRDGVQRQHSDYGVLVNHWQRLRACFAGESAVKLHDLTHPQNRILRKRYPKQNPTEYREYQDRVPFLGLAANFKNIIVDSLLKSPPIIEIFGLSSEEEALIHENIGQNNETLRVFAENMIHEELTTSRAWIRTNQVEEGSPYAEVILPETLIDWRTRLVNGRQVLIQLKTLQEVENYNSETFQSDFREMIQVHELDQNGLYRVRTYLSIDSRNQSMASLISLNTSSNFELIDVNNDIRINGQRLNYIPIFPANGMIQPRWPVLERYCSIERNIYNNKALLSHVLKGGALVSLVYKSHNFDNQQDDSKRRDVADNIGRLISIGEEDSVEYLQFPIESAKLFQEEIDRDIGTLAKLGIRMLATEERSNVSGEALNIRNRESTIRLQNFSKTFGQAIGRTVRDILHWQSGRFLNLSDIRVTLASSFSRDVSIMWTQYLTELVQSGLIEPIVLERVLKDNNLLDLTESVSNSIPANREFIRNSSLANETNVTEN